MEKGCLAADCHNEVRYANLIVRKDASIENIGDWVQIFAVDYIYSTMGIRKEDIVRIRLEELGSYRGIKVILPINFPMFGIYDLSEDIIPVYLGVSMVSGVAADGLKMMDAMPIGCRDDHTYRELTKNGIRAYHGGCMTIAFPKREHTLTDGQTFIVDAPAIIRDNLPEDKIRNAVYITHLHYGNNSRGALGAKEIYKRYWDEASLVITSKIHCAQPCLAMGIPVIFICTENSFRYDVIRNYIPIYTVEDLMAGKVDWNPKPVELEQQKEVMLSNARARIRNAYSSLVGWKGEYEEDEADISRVDSFFRPDHTLKYKIDMIWAFKQYLKKRFDKEDSFQYGVWGLTQFAYAIYEWILKNYPKARLTKVIDNNRNEDFYGLTPEKIDGLRDYSGVMFFTAPSAVGIAKEAFEKYNVQRYIVNYCGLWIEDGTVLSDGDK